MGIFDKFMGKKSEKETLLELRNYYLNDLNRIINILQNSDSDFVADARGILGKMQEGFTKKFGSTSNYLKRPGSERKEYLETLSSVMQRFEDNDAIAMNIGASIFSIILSAIEMGDEELHKEIDKKLIKFFNE